MIYILKMKIGKKYLVKGINDLQFFRRFTKSGEIVFGSFFNFGLGRIRRSFFFVSISQRRS